MKSDAIFKEIQKLEAAVKWFYDRKAAGSKEKISGYEYRQYFEIFNRIENEISHSFISENDRQKLREDYQCSIRMLYELRCHMQPSSNSGGVFSGRWGDGEVLLSMADELQRHVQATTDGSFSP